jgi:phosphate transport system permease protein
VSNDWSQFYETEPAVPGAASPPPFDPSRFPDSADAQFDHWSVVDDTVGTNGIGNGNGNGNGHEAAQAATPVADLLVAAPAAAPEAEAWVDPLDVAANAESWSGAADVPRRLSKFSKDDGAELVGAGIAAVCLTWLVFFRLTPLYGSSGFVFVTFITFLAIYWTVVRQNHGRLAAGERLAAVVMGSAALAAVIPLGLIIVKVVAEGLPHLRANFFTQTQQDTGPLDPATSGGAAHAIVGTLQQVGLAMIISVPLAVLTAVFMNEIGGKFARIVRFVVDTMSGTPSIVAGLFIYSVLILQVGWGFSGFAGALALMILMLPTVTRTTEEMLRLVSSGLREAALALGAPEWRVTMQVVLPTARTGIATAVILGVARAIGETAPVLLTTFGASVMNWNPFSDPQSNLPLFIFTGIRSSAESAVDRAWTGAFVLMGIVLFLFILARIIGGRDHLKR